MNYHIELFDSIQSVIRDSWISTRKGTGTNGAGILFSGCTGCLIENNVLVSQFPHMEINGASIYVPRSVALNTTETCMVCHATGRIADIKAMHAK